jgi:hypothetical protein
MQKDNVFSVSNLFIFLIILFKIYAIIQQFIRKINTFLQIIQIFLQKIQTYFHFVNNL